MRKKTKVNASESLDEIRQYSLQSIILVQDHRTKWHDKFIKNRFFQPGVWALLYDKIFKIFQGKLSTQWLGPYEVDTFYVNGIVKIKTIDSYQTSFIVNWHRLKVYHKSLSK